MNRVHYTANNSGGNWWIQDEHWLALEEAGWTVEWFHSADLRTLIRPDKEGRWLDALAYSAYRDGLTYDQAVAEFEAVTGLNTGEQGCPTCGDPHYFYEYFSE